MNSTIGKVLSGLSAFRIYWEYFIKCQFIYMIFHIFILIFDGNRLDKATPHLFILIFSVWVLITCCLYLNLKIAILKTGV